MRQSSKKKRGHLIYHGRAISTVQRFSGISIDTVYTGLIQSKYRQARSNKKGKVFYLKRQSTQD